jgi:ATP-binding cassette subfamily B protein
MSQKLRWIWDVWRPLRGWFWVLLALTGVSSAAALAYPLALKHLLDTVQEVLAGADPAAAPARVRNTVLLLLAIGLTRIVANLYPATRGYLNSKIDRRVREAAFAAILRKGHRFFLHFRTGDVVTRLTDDINEFPRIAWFCCSGIFRALDSAVKFSLCLAVMLVLDWRLALLSVAPLPVMISLFLLVHRGIGIRAEAHRRAVSETNDLLESSFSGVRIIKAFNAERRQGDALVRQLNRRIEVEMDLVRLQQMVHTMYTSSNLLGQVIVIGVGGVSVIHGEISAGTFYAFYAYLGMLAGPLLDVPMLLVAGRQAFVSIERVEEVRSWGREEEGGALRGTRPAGRIEGLELCGVRFGYAGAEVLRGVDLELRRGQKVAVVGRLGSGKSTLLRVAAGALVPSAGRVLLDGRPLAEYGPDSFGAAVGLAPQEPLLLRGSVRENVVFGRARDEAWLREVIDAVGLTREIEALPAGLEEQLGLQGQNLSGGQRQRLAMARALYGRPQLLLLDDLTSALDAENEDRLWRALARSLPEAAVLVVTHRIATARAMDRIALLEAGLIAAEGTHAELLERSALYREFQQGWVEEGANVL